MTRTLTYRLTSALPFLADGDGPRLCRRFCRRFGQPGPETPHGPAHRVVRIPARLRLADGPALCLRFCQGFARLGPSIIRRPFRRGRLAATANASMGQQQ